VEGTSVDRSFFVWKPAFGPENGAAAVTTAESTASAIFAAPLLAAALSAIAIAGLRRLALPPDVPNDRSLHTRPVPRGGGYAVWIGFVPVALLFAPAFAGGWLGWLPAWAALVIVSAIDDVKAVGVIPRLLVHAAAALWTATWLASDAAIDGGALAFVAMTAAFALAIAWSVNLYNFMDGTDGLAATMAAIGFLAYGVTALAVGQSATAASARASAPALVALAAAVLPFLAVNRPRASMFLGDVGAVPLGFIAAAFGIGGVVAAWWPAWFPLLVFLPFVADATLTLALRAGRGERLWQGHRSHFYQRLHQLGAGHGGTLAGYGIAMVGTASTAVGCRLWAPASGWWALAAWSVVVVMLFAAIDYHWRRNTTAASPSAQ
jgi:UDP-N-acetylmuramyl pentapeptide phosphotransferase/UDP-N-acetylglucosamine-1-phosphate transferase